MCKCFRGGDHLIPFVGAYAKTQEVLDSVASAASVASVALVSVWLFGTLGALRP